MTTDDVLYIKASIDKYVPDSDGTGDYLKREFLNKYGILITTSQKLAAMSEVIRNSFDAFRKSGDFFSTLGDDPDILTLFTPAGSTQLGRLNEQDPVLSQYAIPGSSSFSIVSLANAVGPIATTFQPSLSTFNTPVSLVEVIGNIGSIKPTGLYRSSVISIATLIGDKKITEDPSASITSVIGDTSSIKLDGSTSATSLSATIGNVALNANIPNKNNLITAINEAFTHTKARPVFLTSFCSDHTIPPANTITLSNVMVAAMRVILQRTVTIGDADDLTDCILGASIISAGTPTSLTVTVNACPGFDSGAGTCQPINSSIVYTSKSDCITGTKNYFISLKTGNANIFTNAITNSYIKDTLAGEICAQYDS